MKSLSSGQGAENNVLSFLPRQMLVSPVWLMEFDTGQNPYTKPTSGRRLTLRLLSRRSTLRPPPHALIFHLFFIRLHFFLPSPFSLSVPALCLLNKSNPSLLSYCLWANKTRCIVGFCPIKMALVCQCGLWIDRLKAGSHAELLFLEQGEQVQPHRPQSAQRGEQGRWGREGEGCRVSRKVPGSLVGVETD